MADNIKPEAGMAATYGIMADRYPMIITKVTPSGKTVYAEHADFNRETREVTKRTRPQTQRKFMLKEDGTYRAAGDRRWGYLHVGSADDYRDPNH